MCKLSGRIKTYAREIGADLVGIANVERWRNAPLRMSPQGIMPQARSVVVMGLHHPDGCIEMGGREHPQIIGPYAIQYHMNSFLDRMSRQMGRFLEGTGHQAVPITASNIWRYRGYKELTAQFAPDMSHIYAAVAAGLAELGYSGLAMTPEFGARVRFVSVITDAELEPTPLLAGDVLCDRCMLCRKHCMSGALTEEVPGTVSLEIEGHTYTRADKNLWRCSWGEHFDLDLDLPKPAHVTEEVILETVKKHGVRTGEFGSCLRYCLPAAKRTWDRNYTNAPRRKKTVQADLQNVPETLRRELSSRVASAGCDFAVVHEGEALGRIGIEMSDHLPNACRAVTVGVRVPVTPKESAEGLLVAARLEANWGAYRVARALEDAGYDVVVATDLSAERMRPALEGLAGGQELVTGTVLTNAPLKADITIATPAEVTRDAPLNERVKEQVRQLGAEVVGISPADRVERLKGQLQKIFDGRESFGAKDVGARWQEYKPEIRVERMRVLGPAEHLEGARSVIVIGVSIPEAAVTTAGEPPAEAVGPYLFGAYVSRGTLAGIALGLVKWLVWQGHRAAFCEDLMGTGGWAASPRGPQRDVFTSRFEAVCAGLGVIGTGGFVLSPGHGPHMRYAAVVTDAEIASDAVLKAQPLRKLCDRGCRACVQRCAVHAFGEPVTIEVEGVSMSFVLRDLKRCDWSKRYALVGSGGMKYLGGKTDVAPPEEITAETLGKALSTYDPVFKHRPGALEWCAIACPAR